MYASAEDVREYSWILESTAPVIDYMTNITNFKLPIKRLGFVLTEHELVSYEHWGLISLDGKALIGDANYFNKTILHHEIIHQWIGNSFTVSNWMHQCLQEGSTTYFEWKISSHLGGLSLDQRALTDSSAGRIALLAEGNYPPYVAKNTAGKHPLSATEDLPFSFMLLLGMRALRYWRDLWPE